MPFFDPFPRPGNPTPIDPPESQGSGQIAPQRGPALGYPGTPFRPSFEIPTGAGQIETNPMATLWKWWRAFPNPAFDKLRGKATEWDNEFIRELQSQNYPAIVQREEALRRYFQQGTWETGSIAIFFNPNTFPLAEHDWIMEVAGMDSIPSSQLQGCPITTPTASGSTVLARVFTEKDVVKRGAERIEGAGTITASGTTITGTGTIFRTFFQPGDMFLGPNGFGAVVQSVASNTTLTLTQAPPAFNTVSYGKGVERFPFYPVAQITEIRSPSASFVNGTDYRLSEDKETIQWLSPSSPPLGTPLGMIYDYFPRWSITAQNQAGVTVKGVRSLTVVSARLWKPENLRR